VLERYRRKNRKRRGGDITAEPYTMAEIANRDGFRCGLCHRKVDMRLSGLCPRGPTIDHVIPLSISRDDTRANVQLAHRVCNVAKGARIISQQLALIG
jgi:5-methylcytosine-specific restriction endonuclease McrA